MGHPAEYFFTRTPGTLMNTPSMPPPTFAGNTQPMRQITWVQDRPPLRLPSPDVMDRRNPRTAGTPPHAKGFRHESDYTETYF